jgi:hypothetical protein
VIFATKVEGQLATLTIRLSYAQAATLAGPLEPFRKDQGVYSSVDAPPSASGF